MESMGILGFIFGLSGLAFAIIAWEQITALKKEFNDLKMDLEDSGNLKEQTEL
jgi:hypothetical protein